MKILAFMQNMWVKEPAKVQKILNRHKDKPEFWNKMVQGLLFQGCKSGRVLKSVFGDMVWDIIWDETTKEICDNPKSVPLADYIHIEETLLRIKPDIVITFGKPAQIALERMQKELIERTALYFRLFSAPHPAARQPETLQKIREVNIKIKNHDRS